MTIVLSPSTTQILFQQRCDDIIVTLVSLFFGFNRSVTIVLSPSTISVFLFILTDNICIQNVVYLSNSVRKSKTTPNLNKKQQNQASFQSISWLCSFTSALYYKLKFNCNCLLNYYHLQLFVLYMQQML